MKRLIAAAFFVGLIFSYSIVGPGEYRAAEAIGGGLLYAAIAGGVAYYARRKGSPTPFRWGAAASLTFIAFAAVGAANDI